MPKLRISAQVRWLVPRRMKWLYNWIDRRRGPYIYTQRGFFIQGSLTVYLDQLFTRFGSDWPESLPNDIREGREDKWMEEAMHEFANREYQLNRHRIVLPRLGDS